MKLKKLAKCTLATALIFGSVGAISGCKKDNDNNTTEKTDQKDVYNLYVQYMNAKGDTPLTYEQWLASIKGDKGEDGISPKVRINETTNYWEISTDNGTTWTSTGVKATGNAGSNGHTPAVTVGQNGNWFVDGVDTNVKAQGEKGDPGNDAVAPQVRINQGTNYWEISTDNGVTWTSTGVKATGNSGENGDDGHTPVITIGQNGNWFVDGVDTTIKAQGEKGNPGNDAVAPQIRINEVTNEWEISTDNGETWTSTGVNATGSLEDVYTIEYKYTVAYGIGVYDYYAEQQTTSFSRRLQYMPAPKEEYAEDFDGWYIEGTDIKVETNTLISSNVTLVDRWKNYPSIPAGLYKDGTLIMNWEAITLNFPGMFDDEFTVFAGKNDEFSILTDFSTTLVIDNTVTKIGEEILDELYESVVIPSSVTEIEHDKYNGLALKYIHVNKNNQNYSSENGVLFNKNKTELIHYPGYNPSTTYTIPSSVTKIRDDAFYGVANLDGIRIPEGVIEIGDRAFYEFYGSTVIIPSSVTKIGDEAFGKCRNLIEIIVDKSNQNYYSDDGALYSKEGVLIQYPAGKESSTYYFPLGVTEIASGAFRYSKIKNITIPSTVKKIGEHAFFESDLKELTLPSSVTEIGRFIASNLDVLVIEGDVSAITFNDSAFGNENYVKKIYLKEGQAVDGIAAFEDFVKQPESDKTGYDLYCWK